MKKQTRKKVMKKIEETNDFWEKEIEIGELPYGDSSKHVFSVCVKDGKKYVSMSRWYLSKKEKAWILSNKGTTLQYEELPAIFEMLVKTFNEAKELDLSNIRLFDEK